METQQDSTVVPPGAQPSPAPDPVQPKPKMKLWKKILLDLFVVIVVLAASIYLLPLVLTITHPGDAQLLDDSALRLPPVSVADADNGYFSLNQLNSLTIYDPPLPNQPASLFSLSYTNYSNPVTWDQQMVDNVLAKNQQALDLFSQAAAQDYIQVPQFSDSDNVTPETPPPLLNAWREAERLQAIKALSLSWQGQPDEALLEAIKLNKVGHEIIAGHNSLIGTLVGISMQNLGSQTILLILPFGRPSSQTLSQVTKALLVTNDDNAGFEDSIRFQYTFQINNLNQINGNDAARVDELVQSQDIPASFGNAAKTSYYFKPNQTKNLFETSAAAQIKEVQTCTPQPVIEQLNTETQPVEGFKVFFEENAVGKILYQIENLASVGIIDKMCQTNLLDNVATTELAARNYELQTGQLPNQLTALVPNYINSLPTDPYGSGSLHYDPTKKILYSVGTNGKDLGGSTGDDWMTMDNPTFQIKF